MARKAASIRRDMDAIKDDLTALQSDISDALRDLVAAGKNEAGDVRDRLEKSIRDRLDQLSERAEEIGQYGRRAVDGLESQIEEKPWQSVGIAFGVGLLLGVILRK
ncbi:MAG: YqjD family protein [Phycisphaerales bacterium]